MPVGLRRKSLLVVDDNQPMQVFLRDLGVAEAFDVTTASTHKDALTAIKRRRFDAAIVDKRLVERDQHNREGIAVIAYLSELGEGTVYALLTGYGTYSDAVAAYERYGAHILEKSVEEFQPDVERLLRTVADDTPARRLVPARAWSGGEQAEFWSTQANMILQPKGDYNVTLTLLEELLLTCDPILERIDGRGLEQVPGQAAFAGLFWSRGLGEPVVVVVARDEVPPALPQWPPVTVESEMFRTMKKNLVGAIYRCSGVNPEEFPVRRSYVE